MTGAAATYHLVYTSQGADAVRQMPGGTAWLDVIEKVPQRERHLHIHQGHMVQMNDADLAAWRAGGYVSLPSATLTGSADTVGKAVAAMAQAGATELMYEPWPRHCPRTRGVRLGCTRLAGPHQYIDAFCGVVTED